MDPVWISVAFVLGLVARQVGLPPLVGFLAAGFVLHGFGAQPGEILETVAELGVMLLLFSIGLKLHLRSLARPEVWAVASGHMLITILVFGAGVYGLSLAGVSMFAGLDLGRSALVAFALSFSSTVFAVKVLEEKGEMASLHGRVSIGILIMQDIFAVVFLTASTGKIPSPWALALLALIPLRHVLMQLMGRVGHGELLIVYGLVLAFGGAALFELVGLKPDLGALIFGILVAGHPKAGEMAKSLLGLKDIFLIGFFLSIGFYGLPDTGSLILALVLSVVMVLKIMLFFFLLTRFRLRARTSLLTSLSLANYSEFGLIVGAIGVTSGWISGEWLVIIAIALAITFVVASALNTAAHHIYARLHDPLCRFETLRRLPGDMPIETGDAEVVIFGMGRVGTGAYDALRERYGRALLGIDFNEETVASQQTQGRNVLVGDATDADFWEKLNPDSVQMVMLAMPNHKENMYAAEQLLDSGYTGLVSAIAWFPDEIAELEALGVHAVFNVYAEAGAGFAEHACMNFKDPV